MTRHRLMTPSVVGPRNPSQSDTRERSDATTLRRGDVVLSVPKSLVLYIQDNAGLSLPPDGAWPRVRAGVAADAPEAGKTWWGAAQLLNSCRMQLTYSLETPPGF